jgi:hypothetical protein
MARSDTHQFRQVLQILRLRFLVNDISGILNTQPVCATANGKHSAHIACSQFLDAGGLAFRLAA